MSAVIEQLRAELKANSDPKIAESGKRFFKEDITVYGLKTATVVKIAKKYWAQIKTLPKTEIFGLCEQLYSSGYMEEAFVVGGPV